MKHFAKIFGIIVTLLIIGGAGLALTNVRAILDYAALYGYNPPAEVSKLADATTMDDATRNVFYVNKPELQNKKDFTNSCTKQEETIVLGCYVENDGIYLLKVEDKRLEGIIEVTAAHEVLHAMYDRLDEDERVKVDKMTADFFKGLKNDRIRENVENYRKRDPSVVPNELHSILASEVRDLSPELEQYYSRYFKDRKAIVALSERYEKTFIDLENRVEKYRKQLDTMKTSLDNNDRQINSLNTRISEERARLDRLLSNNDIDEYNAGVSGFNSLVNTYNDLVAERKLMIENYNAIVELYNEVATTEAELVDSLKGAPEPIEDKAVN